MKAIEVCRQEINHGKWRKDFVLDVCMWDKDERMVVLDALIEPNDVIYAQNFHPSEADFFVVFLTNRIGDGTIKEIHDRKNKLHQSIKDCTYIFLKDEPPKKIKGATPRQVADYEELSEWFARPFIREDSKKKVFSNSKIEPVLIEDNENFLSVFKSVLTEYLLEKYDEIIGEKAVVNFNPYPGLKPLSEEHAHCIFGRKKDIDRINKKRKQGCRFFMIYGSSGVGKSSLILAGVLGRLPGTCKKYTFNPQGEPSNQLAEILEGLLPDTTTLAIINKPKKALKGLKKALDGNDGLVIFIDQFERIYSVSSEEMTSFTRILMALEPIKKCTVIIAQRADQMQEWSSRPDLNNSDIWHLQPISHVRSTYLKDVITKPAIRANVPKPEDQLVYQLIEDFDDRENSTPLLALTLHELYVQSGNGERSMTLTDYVSMGGLKGLIDKRTIKLIDELNDLGFGKRHLHKLFSLVVDVNEYGKPISKVVKRKKIEKLFNTKTVEMLIKSFYLRTESDEGEQGSTLTLAHEVYFDEWPLLRSWVDDNRVELREIRDLEREALRWDEHGRSPAYLLPAERVETVSDFIKNSNHRIKPKYSKVVKSFINVSTMKMKQQMLKENILKGVIKKIDELLKEGIKVEKPLFDDSFAVFYDVFWGEKETIVTKQRNGMKSQDHSAINDKSVYQMTTNGLTLLHLAAISGRLDKIKYLFSSYGMDINSKSISHATPLSCASYCGNVDVVKLLLHLDANIEIKNSENGLKAIDWAVMNGHSEIVGLLMSKVKGQNEHMPIELSHGLIVSAAAGSHVTQLIKYLSEVENDKNRIKIIQEALYYSSNASSECVKILIEAGANPLFVYKNDHIFFHWLAAEGKYKIIKLILNTIKGFDVNKQNSKKITPLNMVLNYASVNVEPCIKILLKYGADPSITDDNDSNVLHIIARREQDFLLRYFIKDKRLNLEKRDKSRLTVLAIVAINGNMKLFKALLNAGANPESTDDEGNTVLMMVIRSSHENLLQLLLEKSNSLNVQATNRMGMNALMFASFQGDYPAIKILLKFFKGSAINAVDKSGMTALNYASEKGHSLVLDLLIDNGAIIPLWSQISTSKDKETKSLTSLKNKALGLLITKDLMTSPSDLWNIPPLIGKPGQWKTINKNTAVKLLGHLANTLNDDGYWINTSSVIRVRTLSLECYPDMLLCEAEVKLFDGENGLITFMYMDKKCILLNGTSDNFHKLNENKKIDLTDPKFVVEYLTLFCAGVQSDTNCPFTIVSNEIDIVFINKVNKKAAYWLKHGIKPHSKPEFDEKEEAWKISATIIYLGTIFEADFSLTKVGIVEMIDDQPSDTLIDLPVKTWGFWGNIRRDLTQLLQSEKL
ncbi:MAG: ankyrin repeat domain-containing protein [Alcanivoracaceae bacterium]|nr:ankyrin repeat domain-containing protein [Alcanivoracaceae bacterium]